MSKEIIHAEQIASQIRHFRDEKMLLDFDLAAPYDVAVKILNQSVKRNRKRFHVRETAPRYQAIKRA